MPYLTQPFGLAGALIDLTVGPSLHRQHALRKVGQPVPAAVRVRGLIDTGASLTAIDPTVLQALNLTPTGAVGVLTPTTGVTPHHSISLTFKSSFSTRRSPTPSMSFQSSRPFSDFKASRFSLVEICWRSACSATTAGTAVSRWPSDRAERFPHPSQLLAFMDN